MQKQLLLIEDDAQIRSSLITAFEQEGFAVTSADNGEDGLKLALEGNCDLVVLDLMLPGIDGLTVCRKLRSENARIPVLMLTARGEEIDRVLGLELGADDYLVKPFSVRELIARVRALLRRVETDVQERPVSLSFGPLTIDTNRTEATMDGVPLQLTALEFVLLCYFAQNAGRTVSCDELMREVWHYEGDMYEKTVRTHISRLRAKLEPDPAGRHFIRTVRGLGYRFSLPEEVV